MQQCSHRTYYQQPEEHRRPGPLDHFQIKWGTSPWCQRLRFRPSWNLRVQKERSNVKRSDLGLSFCLSSSLEIGSVLLGPSWTSMQSRWNFFRAGASSQSWGCLFIHHSQSRLGQFFLARLGPACNLKCRFCKKLILYE